MIKYLTIFLISMVPIVELRGALPYAAVFGLPMVPSYIICEYASGTIYFLFCKKGINMGG